MNNLKVKVSYEFRGIKFKSENNYTIDDINIINDIIVADYESLLYIVNILDVNYYELQFKINNEWQYFNNYDYCDYLKNKYFKNNDNIDIYYLLNKLDNMGYFRFIPYIRGLRENETHN